MLRVISGSKKGHKLTVPEGETRAVTDRIKTIAFDWLQSEIQGLRVIDLYAGSGAYGIEALSRGAKHATFVDYSQQAIQAIKDNLKQTGLEDKAQVLQGEIPSILEQIQDDPSPDLAFIDPPYTQIDEFSLSNVLIADYILLRIPADYPVDLSSHIIIKDKKIGISRLLLLKVNRD